MKNNFQYILNKVLAFTVVGVLAMVVFSACKDDSMKKSDIKLISDSKLQDSTFKVLLSFASIDTANPKLNDSLEFMILPLEISCPSCRNKTIDSILKHKDDLGENNYLIVSAKGGRKKMNAFFRDRGGVLPVIPDKVFLDSTHLALDYELVHDNPVIFYTAHRKVYKKVTFLPPTVKDNLHDYFSGIR